ncbi:hypothetical protein Pcinc_039280 [Petrolisthes cinctipes]|uniref:Uncharacterized protein n=1 Tax=Petrolisthes cinctipes TaxID=88211 RepID=A0AAE1BPA0_PETCI|nr:hypothetical protein Pcinc_039280 [Petrolisthes cinctipes]
MTQKYRTSKSALDFNELPRIATRRQRYYPEDDHMKENLRIKCLSHYKTTRTQAEKEKEKLILKDRLSNRIHQFFNSTLDADQFDKYLKTYRQPGAKSSKSQLRQLIPDSSRVSKYTGTSTSKWEEPDTVFGGPSDRKPYSKVETGSSFFSTYGITNRKKDYVAEKVRDYYYFGDDNTKAITDGTTDEAGEEKKERRKKKKSKEREVLAEISATEATSSAVPAADQSTSEVEAVSATGDIDLEGIDDEKERKKLEKKKRKAEREAAAKAAMEAELAALAAAEAELARLEAESSKTEGSAEGAKDAASAEVAAEVKSESAAEKCESSGKAVSEGVCVTPDPAPPTPNQAPSQVPIQVPEEPQVPEPPQVSKPQPTHDDLIIDQPPPLKESQMQSQVDQSKVELPLEETKIDIVMEEPKIDIPKMEPEVEPPVEEFKVEPTMEEPQLEEPPVIHPEEEPTIELPKDEPEAAAEVLTVEEVVVEPPVEVAPVEEPQVAPSVEAQGDEAPVVEEESVGWTPRAPRRTALDDDDAGWLDEWAGEAQQQGSSPLG